MKRICLTPTKNESWIIAQFVKAASMWADHIVVADQLSTDGTWDAIRNLEGVRAVRNESAIFDEAYRQRLLLQHARAIDGPRILIALDADEALSANVVSSGDWRGIQEAVPGTVLRFRWVNVMPGFEQAWIPSDPLTCGFVDDGSEHFPKTIHSCRVPSPPNAPVLDLEDIVVLHFQYTAWPRMLSKQRWYQVWEHLNQRDKGPLDIFRQYSHMHGGWEQAELEAIRPEWFEGFQERGIDFRSLSSGRSTWWDMEILELLHRYGTDHFRRIDIWDRDWQALAIECGVTGSDLNDPRSFVERCVHKLLRATQDSRSAWSVRALEKVLRLCGW